MLFPDSAPQPKVESPESKLRASLASFAYENTQVMPSPRRSPRKPAPRRWLASDMVSDDESEGGSSYAPKSSPRKRKVKEEDEVSASRSLLDSRSPSKSPRKRVKKEDGSGFPVRKQSASPVKKQKGGYAPPETYEHLSPLPDHIRDELDVLFCGFNPGEMSAETGHHFGNPTNGFWRALHGSGLTTAEKALHPSEDGTMPERFCLGLTNLVSRPTNQANELSMTEKRAGAAAVLSKAARHRPRIVCYVGNEIADIMYEAVIKSHVVPKDSQLLTKPAPTRMAKRKGGPPRYGLEPYKIVHADAVGQIRETLFFIMGSTSGRVANYKMEDKIRVFSDLKARVDAHKAGHLDTSNYLVVDTARLTAVPPRLPTASALSGLLSMTKDLKPFPVKGELAAPQITCQIQTEFDAGTVVEFKADMDELKEVKTEDTVVKIEVKAEETHDAHPAE